MCVGQSSYTGPGAFPLPCRWMSCGAPHRVGGEIGVVSVRACRAALTAKVSAQWNRRQGLPLPHEALRTANRRPEGRRQPQREELVTELTETSQKYS